MAKSNRPEAWHDSYKAIFGRYGCIRLTLEQVSVCMGIPARYVRKRYPEGWSNMAGRKAPAAATPSGWIPCWIRNLVLTEEETLWKLKKAVIFSGVLPRRAG